MNLARELAAGNGYVSRVLWLVWLAPDSLPFPYGNPGGPLYSTLLSFFVAPGVDLYRTAILLNLATFLGIVGLVYVFARRIGAPPAWAAVAAGWMSLYPTLVRLTFFPVSDVLATFWGLAALTAAAGPRSRWRAPLAGLACGFAYLARYQMLAFLVGVVLMLALAEIDGRRAVRAALRPVLLALAVFAVVVGPWMLRNVLVFGAPNFSYASRYFVLLGFETTGLDAVTVWNATTPPPDQLEYIRTHFRQYLVGLAWRAKEALLTWPLGGSLFSALSLVGIWVARRRRELYGAYAALAITAGFFVLTYLDVRYLLPMIPVPAALAGLGAAWLARQLRPWPSGRALSALLAGTVFIALAFGCYQLRKDQPRTPGLTAALTALGRELDARPQWSGTVMGGQTPEFLGYFLRRAAVSFPLAPPEQWWSYARRYDVRLLVLTAEEERRLASAAWMREVRPRLTLVREDPRSGLRVYEIGDRHPVSDLPARATP